MDIKFRRTNNYAFTIFLLKISIYFCYSFFLYVCTLAQYIYINNIPKSIALRLGRICDSGEKFDMCSDEYQNYLISRYYNISLVKKQFHYVKSISRSEARQVKQKVTKESFNLVTVYNSILNNLQKAIKNKLLLLHSDHLKRHFLKVL